MPRSELGIHRLRASGSSNDEQRMSSLRAILKLTMPRSELGAHRSRASGSSNDERMFASTEHYLLRAFNNNNSRERNVTPVVTANKAFRSFLAPKDGTGVALYCLCVGCWLYSKQRRTSLR